MINSGKGMHEATYTHNLSMFSVSFCFLVVFLKGVLGLVSAQAFTSFRVYSKLLLVWLGVWVHQSQMLSLILNRKFHYIGKILDSRADIFLQTYQTVVPKGNFHEVNFFQRIAKTIREKTDNSLHEKYPKFLTENFWWLLMEAVIAFSPIVLTILWEKLPSWILLVLMFSTLI